MRSKVNIVAFKEAGENIELILHLPNKHFFKVVVKDVQDLKKALEGVPKVTDPNVSIEVAVNMFNG